MNEILWYRENLLMYLYMALLSHLMLFLLIRYLGLVILVN